MLRNALPKLSLESPPSHRYNRSMSTRSEIVRLLADGQFHSGTALGQMLGISRAAVCKAVNTLTRTGVEVHRVPGRGYRLPAPVVLLSEASMREALGRLPLLSNLDLEILDEVSSTNEHLLKRASTEAIGGQVCVTEVQAQGRGRRGRKWIATPYRNILMSIGWYFETGVAGLSGLSLAAGVAVAEALEEFGVGGVSLKWPNDVLWDGRKLAGLLLDVRGEAAGPTTVVLGLGLNVDIAESDAQHIEQPWIDLQQILRSNVVDRNRLVAILLRNLVQMFSVFDARGLSAFLESWERYHAYAGKQVRVLRGNDELVGTVQGVDLHGALLLKDTAGKLHTFNSGEISLRGLR